MVCIYKFSGTILSRSLDAFLKQLYDLSLLPALCKEIRMCRLLALSVAALFRWDVTVPSVVLYLFFFFFLISTMHHFWNSNYMNISLENICEGLTKCSSFIFVAGYHQIWHYWRPLTFFNFLLIYSNNFTISFFHFCIRTMSCDT